jgi:hypothetical protein
MITKCCTNEIHRFNDEKEYVLLAADILNAVITDERLSLASAKLWQFLYTKARFDKELIVQVEQKYLASCFKKHVRTIARYITELEDFGYIRITPNYGKHGSRIANTYQLSIPESLKASVNLKPNRKKVMLNESRRGVTPPDKIAVVPPDKIVMPNNINKDNTNNNITVVEFFEKENSETGENQSSQPLCSNELKTKEIFHIEQNSKIIANELMDDEQVLPLDKKEIDLINKKITVLQNNLEKANSNIQIAKQNFLTCKEKDEKCKLLRELTEHEGYKHSFQIHLNTLTRQLHDINRSHLQSKQLCQDYEFMLNVNGKRAFSSFEVHRLKKGLLPFFSETQLPKILNEITYAIRFGELEKRQGTQTHLSIQHAISIALKLVREGRWQTPFGLSEFIQTHWAMNEESM